MLGFVFIIIIYAVCLGVCAFIKIAYLKFKKLKKADQSISPAKIYYVKNSTPKKQTNKPKQPNIAISGQIIQKEKTKTFN